MLAIRIFFPQRQSGNSVQPGINSHSNADIETPKESDLLFHKRGLPPVVPGSLLSTLKCRRGTGRPTSVLQHRVRYFDHRIVSGMEPLPDIPHLMEPQKGEHRGIGQGAGLRCSFRRRGEDRRAMRRELERQSRISGQAEMSNIFNLRLAASCPARAFLVSSAPERWHIERQAETARALPRQTRLQSHLLKSSESLVERPY
jgi:hypothetical protein